MSSNTTAKAIFLVDDDAGVLRALARVIRGHGWSVETFASAEAFLARPRQPVEGCLVLDVSMPGIDGLELQRRLAAAAASLPIIFVSGHGDIPMSVQAIKAGASDFLTKPVQAQTLVAAIRAALELNVHAQDGGSDIAELRRRLDSLTLRERQVLTAVTEGRRNKQIAGDLGVVEQTVKFHRARIMEKMQAANVAVLMHMAARLGIGGPGPTGAEAAPSMTLAPKQ